MATNTLQSIDHGAESGRLINKGSDPGSEPSRESRESTVNALRLAAEGPRRQIAQLVTAVQRFLPPGYPEISDLQISAHCRPCADLGGDFYDAFVLGDGRVALCIADVSGHGATAAILMATSRALFRASVMELQPGEGPAVALQRLSRWLQGQSLASEFVTMWLGLYAPATQSLTYAACAHPRAVIWRFGELDPEYLNVEPTFPLGLEGVEMPVPPEARVPFSTGDRLFLYTDGWIETASANGDFLEDAALLEFFANSAGLVTNQVSTLLFYEFERHAANTRIRDDISLMVIDCR